MKKLILLGIIVSLLWSCNKNNDLHEDDLPEISGNYYPLEIGNYWVYQHYRIDTLGNETKTSHIDSIVVSAETQINNHTYFVLTGQKFPIPDSVRFLDMVRDSSGYIVSYKGNICFSENNFNDILDTKIEIHKNDTLYRIDYKMLKEDNKVSVPAGTFEVLNFQGTLTSHSLINHVENPRFIDTYFVEGIGKILQSYYYLNGTDRFESRLIRYHINRTD